MDPTPWRETLPEEIRNDPSLVDFKDVAALAKSHIETKKLVGASIRVPGPDAAPEARKAFVEKLVKADPNLLYLPDNAPEEAVAAAWQRLGRPGKPEDYAPPDEETGKAVNLKELQALAQVAGLTKAQFQVIVKATAAGTVERTKAQTAEVEALKTEWGGAYEERLLLAKATALKMGLAEDDLGGLTPKQLRAWAAAAKAVGTNPSELQRQGQGGSPAMTPAEIESALADIRGNPEYWDDSTNPGKSQHLRQKAVELTAKLHPG